MNRCAAAARPARGITLIECVIAVAILAALMSVALPSFADAMARARLRSAAQDLALGLGNARLESVRAGAGMVHVTVVPGAAWCWSVGPVADVDCLSPAAGSTVHVVRAEDHPGITMVRGGSASFDRRDTLATAGFAAEFVSSHGGALRVHVTPLGRAIICAPEGRSLDFPRCM
jgi:prepilin-type N-terminal cleavage/methylation domain-containing protein